MHVHSALSYLCYFGIYYPFVIYALQSHSLVYLNLQKHSEREYVEDHKKGIVSSYRVIEINIFYSSRKSFQANEFIHVDIIGVHNIFKLMLK